MASSAAPDLTGKVLRHERLFVAAGIALLIALSWWFLASGAGLGGMAANAMHPPLAALVAMWWLMMIAMMLPSAAPAALLYGRVRAIRIRDGQVAPTGVFLAGYLGVWLLFSICAALAQQFLAGSSMAPVDPRASSAILIAAGLYQLSPLKTACLRQCRSPAQFLSREWRPGIAGALRLGILHGTQCLGCCWMLMALLFVGGVMNFAWIAALTLIVGVEKLAPRGDVIGRLAGLALIAWGSLRLLS
jgi:predicted metal-binding membrane protein